MAGPRQDAKPGANLRRTLELGKPFNNKACRCFKKNLELVLGSTAGFYAATMVSLKNLECGGVGGSVASMVV